VERGAVLGYSGILERLKQGEIFRQGTWGLSCIRAASYDLRIADDFMIIQRRHGDPPLIYGLGRSRREIITLKPGQVAFFSTAERLCMPWDLAGQISIKSSWPRRGLLVLGGQQVDPGFGRDQEEERLHFLVMNIGAKEVHIRPGEERLASLQLLALQGEVPDEIRERPVRGMRDVQEILFETDPDDARGVDLALGFFSELAQLQEEFQTLERKHDQIAERINDVRSGALPLISFGIIVLALTFLGVVLDTLLQIAGNKGAMARLHTISAAAGGGSGILGVVIAGVAATIVAAGLLYGISLLVIKLWRAKPLRRIIPQVMTREERR
jgi:deoxycytidine triphosphate deaminase